MPTVEAKAEAAGQKWKEKEGQRTSRQTDRHIYETRCMIKAKSESNAQFRGIRLNGLLRGARRIHGESEGFHARKCKHATAARNCKSLQEKTSHSRCDLVHADQRSHNQVRWRRFLQQTGNYRWALRCCGRNSSRWLFIKNSYLCCQDLPLRCFCSHQKPAPLCIRVQ